MTARLILAPLLLRSNYDVDDHYQHVHVVVRTRRKYMHNAAVGMVGGLGYDGQLKCNICDTCRPYHWILSILKPVFFFAKFNIFIVLTSRSDAINDDRTNHFTPAHAHRVNICWIKFLSSPASVIYLCACITVLEDSLHWSKFSTMQKFLTSYQIE